METFAALQLEINSWRWKGVPFYIRAGKNLPMTCTEIIGRFRQPPACHPEVRPVAELSAIPYQSRNDDCHGRDGDGSGVNQ